MTFDTAITERQLKAEEWLDRIYAVASHLFLIGAVVVYVCYLTIRFVRTHPWAGAAFNDVHLGFPAQAAIVLGATALLLLLLKGLLYLFKIVRATELTKLYLFIELFHLIVEYTRDPHEAPVPFIAKMLQQILEN